MDAIEKLKALDKQFDFNIQIFDGDYNIYCMAQDFHNTDIASVGGYKVLEDAVDDLLQELENKGYEIDKANK